MWRSWLCVVPVVVLLACPARAEVSLTLIPPADGTVGAAFDRPAHPYAAGHRGIDYAVPIGSRVRAAAAGYVSFAGTVAGRGAVTIDHGSGIQTTYTGLATIAVEEGEMVTQGRFIATSGSAHGRPGVHFGVIRDGAYVDPNGLLVDIDLSAAIHLAPVYWTPDRLGTFGSLLSQPAGVGTSDRNCENGLPLAYAVEPPNDNVAVAVAGITSKTRGGIAGGIYEDGPEKLGYPKERVYRFSYAGVAGRRFHEPYERTDTYGNIRIAARRLRALMLQIARKHPGRNVDLIAHSQGGIVARTYLALVTDDDRGVPPVDHLVTFASPHLGAPAAGETDDIRGRTVTGRHVLDKASDLSQTMGIPDPDSVAVEQLAPDSDLMNDLATEDVAFGVRVLALAIPNDPIVPADHALYPGEQGRVVPWTGHPAAGHKAIVTSPAARSLAYRFLAGHAPSCTTSWDRWGPRIGALYSGVQSSLAEGYTTIESTVFP